MSDVVIIKGRAGGFSGGPAEYVQIVDIVENGSGITRCKELYSEYEHAGDIEFHVIHGYRYDLEVIDQAVTDTQRTP